MTPTRRAQSLFSSRLRGLTPPVGEAVPWSGSGGAPDLSMRGRYRSLLTGSGTEALALALLAGRHGQRDEVVVPAYTCPDVVMACRFAGLSVRAVDTLPGRPWIDPASLSRATNDRTLAVIVPAFLGAPAPTDEIDRVARDRDLLLIQDHAQVYPVDPVQEPTATLAILSFGRGKPVSVLTGGALLYDRCHEQAVARVAARLEQQPGLGRLAYWATCIAYNVGRLPLIYGLLDAIPALALGVPRVTPLARLQTMAPAAVPRLAAAAAVAPSRPSPAQLTISAALRDSAGRFVDLGAILSRDHQLPLLRHPVLVRQGAAAEHVDRLRSRGVGASRLYGNVLPEIPGLDNVVREPLPNATAFARQLFTLPVHSGVTRRHLDVIVGELTGHG